MATTMYFEKEIKDQDKENSLFVEFGRSSYYAGCRLEDGSEGQDSIYLNVNGSSVLMDVETAREFVNAAAQVGSYLGLFEE
nr:hypothetical protein [uncultured Cohaesibacter sp.]